MRKPPECKRKRGKARRQCNELATCRSHHVLNNNSPSMLHVCPPPGDLPALQISPAAPPNKKTKTRRSGRGNDFKLKYKTELCRGWEKGECAFGAQCAFAHGPWELRERPLPVTPKTKPCRSFLTQGYCLQGARCQFIHNLHNRPYSSDLTGEPFVLTFPDTPPHRLPVFVSLGGLECL